MSDDNLIEAWTSTDSTLVEAVAMPPEELNRYMRTENEKWSKVVRDTGATVN